MKNYFTNIIFLDIDGVLNCELFYKDKFDNKNSSLNDYYKGNLCKNRVSMLNTLCEETNSAIVISSTWRLGRSIYELQEILNSAGATFTIISVTPYNGWERGTEIRKWLKDNCMELFGVKYFDFYRYAIIDDDSDMLLWQQNHFFQTDGYSGLTYNTCYKINRFFTHNTF